MVDLKHELPTVLKERLRASLADIEAYCQRWQIVEFALFGSVLRDDFRPDSDVDVLVTFAPDERRTLMDLVQAQQELEDWFGRKVDLTQKKNLANPFSKAEILSTHQVIYPVNPAAPITICAANQPRQDHVRNHAALFDMAQSIAEIQEFIQGETREQYLASSVLRRAVERHCGIIARAVVHRIRPEFRAAHPAVNWADAARLEALLAYPYDRANDPEIWRIVSTELPGLLEQIQGLIPPLPYESN
ncbi:MAG: nucleotidyltransferase domain-containing protein [Cyanobacteriota bacterium]